MDFSGQTILITGGASGMGAACVRAFAAAGANVVLIDKNPSLAAEVSSQTNAVVELGDVSSSAFCDAVVARALERFGRVDGLVNAAGIIVRASGLETSDEAWQRMFNVNVSGSFFMARAALRPMKAQQSGAIVNFGSIWGDVGAAGVAAYCASKGAIHNLTRALALEHAGDNIRINAVCPGEVNTPMLQSERSEPVSPDLLERLAATVPMGRLAAPEEIAQVVLFLASGHASYMTGSLVMVDGGFIAR
jgi:meso-butanediol dehydrogenase / (S,S)-butanediol dehydrogenase / diacetyl reductase